MGAPIDRYRFDDWSLEPSEARLLKDDQPVAIEPRAFDVLAYFVAHPQRLVTKDELLGHAWPDAAVSDNALTRAITRLRKVLGDHARSPRYIETVHSRGYRFLLQPEVERSPPSHDEPEGPAVPPRSPELVGPVDGPVDGPGAVRGPLTTSSPDGFGRRDRPGVGSRSWWRRFGLAAGAVAIVVLAIFLGRLGDDRKVRDGGGQEIWPDQIEATALSPHQRRWLEHPPTQNAVAFRHYLRGRGRYEQQTRIGNEQAIEAYSLALVEDPDFALAHAGLANAYALRVVRYGFEARWRHEAEAAVRWALRLDPRLPEAHKAEGLLHDIDERLELALASYRRALELEPGYVEAAYNASSTAYALGRWDEAVQLQLLDVDRPDGRAALAILLFELGLDTYGRELARQVLEREPLHGYLGCYLALRALLDGGLDRGRQQAERLVQAFPTWWRPHWVLAEIALREGRIEEALAHYATAAELSGEGDWEAPLGMAATLHRSGEVERAERLMAEIEADSEARILAGSTWHAHPFRLAAIAALRGQRRTALGHFEAALGAGRSSPRWDAIHPAFEGLRRDPELEALLGQMEARIVRQRQAVAERLTSSAPGRF